MFSSSEGSSVQLPGHLYVTPVSSKFPGPLVFMIFPSMFLWCSLRLMYINHIVDASTGTRYQRRYHSLYYDQLFSINMSVCCKEKLFDEEWELQLSVDIRISILNHHWVKDLKKEIKDFLEFNENKSTTHSNLWETMKAVLKGKFIALYAHIKNLGKSHTSNSIICLKAKKRKRKRIKLTKEE